MHAYMPGPIGERINDLVIERKTTQAQLATEVGVSEATMSRYVKGTTVIPSDVLMKIEKIFQCHHRLSAWWDQYSIQDQFRY